MQESTSAQQFHWANCNKDVTVPLRLWWQCGRELAGLYHPEYLAPTHRCRHPADPNCCKRPYYHSINNDDDTDHDDNADVMTMKTMTMLTMTITTTTTMKT